MIAKMQAAILALLVTVAAYCACFLLCAPVAVVAGFLDMDEYSPHSGRPVWLIWYGLMALGILAAAQMGWLVARDWYRRETVLLNAQNSTET